MHNVGRALDDVNVGVDVVSHKTMNLNLWAVNFSFFLSSPPLWIVAIHDFSTWVSSLLISVDAVTSECSVLYWTWSEWLWLDYHFYFRQIWYLRCFCAVVPSLSALGCPSVQSPWLPLLFLTAPFLSGSSGAGVPTEAAARAGRSSKENHPAA